MAESCKPKEPIYALVDYQDKYVQPLILSALQSRFPSNILVLIKSLTELPPSSSSSSSSSKSPIKLLQWKQYEELDLDLAMQQPATNLINSYIIRKALIRKHYLSNTVSHWSSKHPSSTLTLHIKPGVEFELDFAEFLDDALVEAFELTDAFAKNEALKPEEREWWILKPGMSDRGQGIRLFSTEAELTAIFEEWDPPSDDDDDEDEDDEEAAVHSSDDKGEEEEEEEEGEDDEKADGADSNGIITSQLRHFVAQPYIHPPLLLPPPFPSANRKFHIRTYVVCVGALKVYVYRHMLALFAAKPYTAPWGGNNGDENDDEEEGAVDDPNDHLSAHLTNTCLQTGEREGSVHPFWSLPRTLSTINDSSDWKTSVFEQICQVTGEVFEAAARGMMVHFQPLPNAFEVFGVDFLVDEKGNTSLLEVNAFPDFAQTGAELNGLIEGLFEEVVEVAIKPFFGLQEEGHDEQRQRMVKVLDIDLGRR